VDSKNKTTDAPDFSPHNQGIACEAAYVFYFQGRPNADSR
jgi:hypothetical protein